MSTPIEIISSVLDRYMLPLSFGMNVLIRMRQPKRPNLLEFVFRSDDPLDKDWLAQFLINDKNEPTEWMFVDLRGFHRHKNMLQVAKRTYQNTDERGEPDGSVSRVYNVTQFPVGILVAASERVLAEIAAVNPLVTLAVARRQSGDWAGGHPYGSNI